MSAGRGGALALLLLAACGARHAVIDLRALEEQYPAVAAQRGHRLAEVAPHFWVSGGELLLFHCRWAAGRAVPVAVAGATGPESALVDRALAALEDAVPGLVFERTDALDARAGVALSIVGLPPSAGPVARIPPSGEAAVDCRVEEPFGGVALSGPLRARLERASVEVLRSRYDGLGRVIPLSEAELLAVLLHELGHAIGYPAHARGGNTIMRANPWEVELRARAVMRGERLEEPTLAALYALPTGSVLARVPAAADVRVTARVFGDLARRQAWGSARSRAGQSAAEVWWSAPDGDRRVLRARRGAGRWPAGFVLHANAAARDALRRAPPWQAEPSPASPAKGRAGERGEDSR